MASLGKSFDSTQINTDQPDFTPLPNGTYELEVTASDVVPTKAGNGTILKLTYEVRAPAEYATRRIFGQMNLENANAQAAEIGQRELAMLCRAVGVSELSDSQELHLISFFAKVGLEKPQPGYAQRNKIVKFHYPDEGSAPEVGIDANQPAPAAPANDNRPDNRPSARPAAAAAAPAGRKPWGQKN